MSCVSAHDPQLSRLASAIAKRVGMQRFHVWFDNSTRLDLKTDGLEIAVPNDFISEWIGTHFKQPIQDAAHEVLGCSLEVRFNVVPQLFEEGAAPAEPPRSSRESRPVEIAPRAPVARALPAPAFGSPSFDAADEGGGVAVLEAPPVVRRPVIELRPVVAPAKHTSAPPRLRHDLDTFIVGASNQLAYNAATYVCEYPGSQYNPLFVHGDCGLGKTHLLQGICRRFMQHHPTKRWMYLSGEEFTNDFLTALRTNKLDAFRRKMRDLDLLVIDDVHFLSGKKATQEEFLHTFNAIEAMGRQVVMVSDSHPKMIEEFGESLINRFVSGMVVRIDPPNYATRCEILRSLARRMGVSLGDEVVTWIARRVTQNIRELEGAVTRIAAHVKMTAAQPDLALVQHALGDLDRHLVQPIKPDNILSAVCGYFGIEMKDLMSGRRQRTISLARSMAMFLIRRTAKLSYPEIGGKMGKRNHSTVISACRRIEKAAEINEKLAWTSAVGEREEEAVELIQRLEELARAMN